MIRVFSSNISIAFANLDLSERIESTQREMIFTLGELVESRSKETGNHVRRVGSMSAWLGRKAGMDEREVELLALAAPLHDIGKIGIPDEILLKPGRLSPREMDVMRRHTLIGYEILKDSPSRYLQQGAVIAVGHHERYDGSGYPKGLRGEEIPMVARIVAVADVYDALTSVRPYKPAWPSDEAVGYVTTQRARHFDPQCVDAFLARLDSIREVQAILRDGGVVDEG
jgi:two-component system response regulator RpfG